MKPNPKKFDFFPIFYIYLGNELFQQSSRRRGHLLLLGHSVADDAGVVALEGLEGHLLRRLELLRLQLLHFAGKHRLRRHRAVDAVSLSEQTLIRQDHRCRLKLCIYIRHLVLYFQLSLVEKTSLRCVNK